jgi:hypothetical protein
MDNPILILICLAMCWPGPVAIVLVAYIARNYDISNPLRKRRRTGDALPQEEI